MTTSASNHHQAAFSTAQHVGNDINNVAPVPQSPCGAPSSEIRKNEAENDDGVANIHNAMAMMTMAEDNEVPTNVAASAAPAAKENVRPNSGRRKWRKKLDQKNRRAAAAVAAAGDEEMTTTLNTAMAGSAIKENHYIGNQIKTLVEKKAKNNNGKKLHLKNKKAVVVEISSQKTLLPVAAVRTPILPPRIDYNAAEVSADISSSLTSSNDELPSGSNSGRVKKSRSHKNKKHPSRRRSKSKKGDMNYNSVHATSNEFSTNAGGASVLALLGQYPYAVDPPAEISYDGSSSPNSQVMMMSGGGDTSNYYVQYDPSTLPSPGNSSGGGSGSVIIPSMYSGQHAYPNGMQQYPTYTAPDTQQQPSSATVMMAAGYYVPVMMTNHNNEVVYYNQHTGATEYPVYYSTYAPYGTALEQPSAAATARHQQHPVGTSSKTLNIDAPAFNPKDNHDE